ncbi:hypothetical protein [Paenibacillus nasutitermitis]|uniref:Uncharacterized protein n=1 Tax=Paenibacillus nasutitermitis TaxID=1652958 RepID=A0A916ZF50_9BACL|nr:hypothetical protein [Paenibacillus nasutitermitis]GGD91428.1 hypothetical protein GCM10010911_57670 [Paenibacillus nasutitermitis]
MVSLADQVKQMLESHPEIVEIQVEYLNGEKKDYSMEEDGELSVTREAAISHLLSEVDWAQVDEIEVEYENGDKSEMDVETGELEAPEADDDDDDEEDSEEEVEEAGSKEE